MTVAPRPASGPVPRDPDVLVVGGGIVGLFCAYHLRRGGRSVVVVERGAVGGPQSCSHGNTGFVGTTGAIPLAEPGVVAQGLRWLLRPDSPFHVKPRWDAELWAWLLHFRRACDAATARAGFETLLEMKKRSLSAFRDLCGAGGLAETFRDGGKIIAFDTPEGFAKAAGAARASIDRGVPLRILSPDDVRALDPGADFEISGALHNADDACLQPSAFLVRFATMLAGMGVHLVTGAEVGRLVRARERLDTVHTSVGDFAPREVVIAAGVWSGGCARDLGLRLALQPAKGYAVTVKRTARAPSIPVLLAEGKVAVAPGPETLRLGGQMELGSLDDRTARHRISSLLATAKRSLPGLADAEVIDVWSGFRPCSPDGLPFIGRPAGLRNVTVASGGGHIGMGLAPTTGRLVSQIVDGERPEMDIAPFRLDRFAFGWRLLSGRPRRPPLSGSRSRTARVSTGSDAP